MAIICYVYRKFIAKQGMLHQDASWKIHRARFNVSQVKKMLHVFLDKDKTIKHFGSDVILELSWHTESWYAHIYHFYFKADATLILCTSICPLFLCFSFFFMLPFLSLLCIQFQWLNEEKIIQRLVDMVQPFQDEDVSFYLHHNFSFISLGYLCPLLADK